MEKPLKPKVIKCPLCGRNLNIDLKCVIHENISILSQKRIPIKDAKNKVIFI